MKPTRQDFEDLFVNFFETGYSDYWAKVSLAHYNKETRGESVSEKMFSKLWDEEKEIVIFDSEDDTESHGSLTKRKLLKAIKTAYVMDLNICSMNEWDAVDTDTFIQYVIFGEIVFG